MSKGTGSFWRMAGYNYLQYLSICSGAVRMGLKVRFIYRYHYIAWIHH